MAETIVSVGFDVAVCDMQHGEASLAEVREAIAAVRLAGKPAGVRAGLDGYAEAAHMLDLGAELAILPMVNSVCRCAQARRHVEIPAGRTSAAGGRRAASTFWA